jgi:prepilin peptidase CpaA
MGVVDLAVASLALVAAGVDLRHARVPDALTYPGMAIGVLLAMSTGGPQFTSTVAGLGVAAMLFLTLYRLHSIGGGDVKLMMAVGAIKGATFTVFASFYILAFGVAAAFLVLGWRRRLFASLQWIGNSAPATMFSNGPAPVEAPTVMPFAPVICVGVWYCLALEAVRGPFAFGW